MKDLVNAILDRQIEARDLMDRTIDGAAASRKRLLGALRALASPKDEERKRETFVQAFEALVLAELGQAFPEAIAISRRGLYAEAVAATKLGPARAREIPALRDEDVMRRKAEKAGVQEPEV